MFAVLPAMQAQERSPDDQAHIQPKKKQKPVNPDEQAKDEQAKQEEQAQPTGESSSADSKIVLGPSIRSNSSGTSSGSSGNDAGSPDVNETYPFDPHRAAKNVDSFLGPDQPYRVEIRDVYEGIEPSDSGPAGLDRIVLDLPEPWRVVKHATVALRPGGILVSYLPTIGQVARLREELDNSPFGLAETLEVLQRTWHVEGQSVRPDHRMVAHTGFLTAARLLDPDLPGPPQPA